MGSRMQRCNLYIPVEVKNREFFAKVFLASHAARKGFNVILGRKSELNELVVGMPPGIYYGLGAFENLKSFYDRLQRLGFAVVVNEEEGLVTYSDSMYVDMRISGETLGHIEELLTWGGENQRVLTRAFPDKEGKFHVTGNPRFDLLKLQNHNVYADEMAQIEKKYGKFALVCTSFSSINHFDRNLDYIQSLIEKKTLRSESSIESFKRYREVKAKTFAAFLEAISRLAEENPETCIVVRPHPSENPDAYRDLETRYANIHVDVRFSVHPWIIKAQALVHHYCTTSLEALAVGTPRFALRPVNDPLSEKEFPFSCSVECNTVEKLVQEVSRCLTQGRENFEKSPLPEDYSWYVSNIGDQLATEAIVERFCRVCEKAGLKSRTGGVRALQRRGAYMVKKRLRGLVRRKGLQGYVDHKFPHLSLEEVVGLLECYGAEGIECRKMACDFINIKSARMSDTSR